MKNTKAVGGESAEQNDVPGHDAGISEAVYRSSQVPIPPTLQLFLPKLATVSVRVMLPIDQLNE